MENYSIDCLVTTYNYSEKQIVEMLESMNLFTHTIVRNQNGTISHKCITINNQNVDIFCSNDIGSSKNRNELLKISKADFVIFCDDDEIFAKNSLEIILECFNKNNADCFVFNIDGNNIGRGTTKRSRRNAFRKCKWKDIRSTGVWRLLIKREIALNFPFDERIGPGTKYLCGEDTLFLFNIFNKIKIFIVGKTLATLIEKQSTWYNNRICDNYLFVKGYVYKILYPRLFKIYILRFLIKEKLLTVSNYKKCLYGPTLFIGKN